MPAVGILKKAFLGGRPGPPPPPPPVPAPLTATAKKEKTEAPTKPLRSTVATPGSSSTDDVNKAPRDVRFTDDDEPKTEDSYDFKDIDLASEIFNFRIPPPRPKPPRKNPPAPPMADDDQNENASGGQVEVTAPAPVSDDVADVAETSIASVVSELEDDVTEVEDEPGSVVENRIRGDREQLMTDEDGRPTALESKLKGEAGQHLAKFLLDHEGRELSMDDVVRLEHLLNETEREEQAIELNGGGGDGLQEEDEEEHPRRSAVRFGHTEIRDLHGVVVGFDDDEFLRESSDEDELHVGNGRAPHFADVAFFREGQPRPLPDDFYEPVGPPDMRHLKPDLSGYVPPVPSSNVGDPFAWRRRGKRRFDCYTYEPIQDRVQNPSINKILDGCQEVEDMIVSRDLSPPGTLVRKYGVEERPRKRKGVPMPPGHPLRPAPPLPPKMRIPSPLPPIPTDETVPDPSQKVFVASFSNNDDENPVIESLQPMDTYDLDVLASIESEIIPVDVKPEVAVGSTAPGQEVATATRYPLLSSVATEEAPEETMVMEEHVFCTGDDVTTAQSVVDSADADEAVLVKSVTAHDKMQRVSSQDAAELADRDRRSRKEMYERIRSRPPRPPPPLLDMEPFAEIEVLPFPVFDLAPPLRPQRRKRVSSAEAPLTTFGLERFEEPASFTGSQLPIKTPRSAKPKRSSSFHTADDIRRRIDIQAQHFLRTPRRKDRMSSTYSVSSPSASSTLTYGSLRRPRPPLTPVYSHVNKDITRTRDASMQTGMDSEVDGDNDSLPPALPPKLGELEGEETIGESLNQTQVITVDHFAFLEEDSSVPEEFNKLRSPDVQVVVMDTAPPQNVSKSTDFDENNIVSSTLTPSTDTLSRANRPLPPPPAPPRHRSGGGGGGGTKSIPMQHGFPPNTPIVFCGILPKGVEVQETSDGRGYSEVPEMRVLRLCVGQLEASVIRVSQIQADHLVARLIEQQMSSSGPPPPGPPAPPEHSDDKDGPPEGDGGDGGHNGNFLEGGDHPNDSPDSDLQKPKDDDATEERQSYRENDDNNNYETSEWPSDDAGVQSQHDDDRPPHDIGSQQDAYRPTLHASTPPPNDARPPLHASTPPKDTRSPQRASTPPIADVRPPLHASTPPKDDAGPPLRVSTPPKDDARPPLHVLTPPEDDVRPPLHASTPPKDDVRPPLHASTPPKDDARPQLHDFILPLDLVRPPQDDIMLSLDDVRSDTTIEAITPSPLLARHSPPSEIRSTIVAVTTVITSPTDPIDPCPDTGRPKQSDPLLAYLDERYNARCAAGHHSPPTTVTTSDSASYVTCDETLHSDLDLTNELDDDRFSVEHEYGVALDDEEDAATTGCHTPTELEMDLTIGDDHNEDDDDDGDHYRADDELSINPLSLSDSLSYVTADAGTPSSSLLLNLLPSESLCQSHLLDGAADVEQDAPVLTTTTTDENCNTVFGGLLDAAIPPLDRVVDSNQFMLLPVLSPSSSTRGGDDPAANSPLPPSAASSRSDESSESSSSAEPCRGQPLSNASFLSGWCDKGSARGHLADNDASDCGEPNPRVGARTESGTPPPPPLSPQPTSSAATRLVDEEDDADANSVAEIKKKLTAIIRSRSSVGGSEPASPGMRRLASSSSSSHRDDPDDDDSATASPFQRSRSLRGSKHSRYVRNSGASSGSSSPSSATTSQSTIVRNGAVRRTANSTFLTLNADSEPDGGSERNGHGPAQSPAFRLRASASAAAGSASAARKKENRVSSSSSMFSDVSSEFEVPSSTAPHSSSEDDGDVDTSAGSGSKRDSDSDRRKAFLIATEVMTSERVFVDVLRLLTEDFRKAIDKAGQLNNQAVIPPEVFSQILDGLPQLLSLNEDMLNDLEERISNWDQNERISDILASKAPFLKMYASYIRNYPLLTTALEEARKKFPQFSQAVKDFEMSERCKNLGIQNYMLKPVQRIPQYRLLLQDYLKNINEASADYGDTQVALAIVSEVADHANETIRQTENFAAILQLQKRILGTYLIVKPGRRFIKEGELSKQCRKDRQPRIFLLFNDCLLHCSQTAQGLLKIHHNLPLTGMKVLPVPKTEEFKNEFNIISVARSFTLAANSQEERDEWLNVLNATIEDYVARKKTFVQAKISSANAPDGYAESLGYKAPVWTPDARVTMCQTCAREFTLTFRRHHCRACGKVVCYICSANRAPLRYLQFQAARVCDECFIILHREIDERGSVSSETFDQDSTTQEGDLGNDEDEKKASAIPSMRDIKAQFKKFNIVPTNDYKKNLSKVLQEVTANDEGSSMSGHLHVRMKKQWKKKWFVIKDKVLYTYKASQDVVALNSTPLLGFDVKRFSTPQEGIQPQLYFELQHDGYPSSQFYAESDALATRWIEAMRQASILE